MNIYLKTAALLYCALAIINIQNASSADSSASTIESTADLPISEGDLNITEMQPNFANPMYPIKSNIDLIYIPNASVANFSSDGVIGLTIRYAQSKNDIPNPNGYTHSGFLFHANPANLVQKISELMHTPGNALFTHQEYGAEMIYNIVDFYPEAKSINSSTNLLNNAVFCAESDGSVGEVVKGIYPHVHVHPFEQNVSTYSGEVSFRPCSRIVSPERTLEIVSHYLGNPYESPFTLGSMIKAVRDNNKVEKTNKLFCSEFVALAYRDLELLPSDYNVSNALPEEFSIDAGKYDILQEFCGQDIRLKNKHRRLFCGCTC